MDALLCALMALYLDFKPVSKSFPNPEGLLSETLPSVTTKAANEVVLAVSIQSKELAKEQPCVIQACITVYKSIIINNCSYYIANSELNSSKIVIFEIFLQNFLPLLQNFLLRK